MSNLILSVIPIVLGIGVIGLYVGKLRKLLVEIAEVLIAVDKMLEDGQVTTDEIAKVVIESKDVWIAVKAFGAKK